MTKDEQTKLLGALLANLQLTIELIDESQSTSFNVRLIKRYSNLLQKECLNIIDVMFDNMDESTEMFYNNIVTACEVFCDTARHKDLTILTELLKEFKNGNVGVVDDNFKGEIEKL